METGKFGIKLWCYAVAAFVFGILDLYLGVLAVAAYAIIAEKDKWLNSQVIQALLLYLLYQLILVAIDWSIGGLLKLLLLLNSFGATGVLRDIIGIIKDIVFVAYLVFTVIAVFRCISGKNGVFFLSKISDKLTNLKEKPEEKSKETDPKDDVRQDESEDNNE